MSTLDEFRVRDDRAAVDKAVAILKAFGEEAHLGIGVSELARRSELSKSTAFRILAMLERNGVVERSGNAYRLGRVLHELGAQVYSPDHDKLRDLLTPHLADLYEATHQTVHLAVLHGTDVVYLNKLFGHRHIRTPSRIGGRVPAYCTAVGKILLAFDGNAAERTMMRPMHAWTSHTITDPMTFREQLATARATGVAHDDGESLEDLSCVSAPVMGAGGNPIAAMSVSGNSATFNPAEFERVLRQVSFAASRSFSRATRQLIVA